ncbi:hypothetical protein ERJ75_001383200 [Trypanosoma vivax]|nr:hypothetical protein ERJ75_001383200 [Trypanosoma vivax]
MCEGIPQVPREIRGRQRGNQRRKHLRQPDIACLRSRCVLYSHVCVLVNLSRSPRSAVLGSSLLRISPCLAAPVCAGEAFSVCASALVKGALHAFLCPAMEEDGPVRVSTRRVDGNAAPSAQPGAVGTKESRVVANAGGRPKLPVSHHRPTLHRCRAVSYAVAEVLWQLAQLSVRLSTAALVGALPAFPTRTVCVVATRRVPRTSPPLRPASWHTRCLPLRSVGLRQ